MEYTDGQKAGFELFTEFFLGNETVMLLKGYSGTGKSTLVTWLIDELPRLEAMKQLIDPDFKSYEVALTATTNQAAESLAMATGHRFSTKTIHSELGLRLQVKCYQTGKKELVPTRSEPVRRKLIFIDEVSYVNQELLGHIFRETEDCKIVLIGDPAQLTPVGSNYMPAFNLKNKTIELTEPVRFDKGPVADLVHELRATVLGAPFPNFSKHVMPGVLEKLPMDEFQARVLDAFSNPDKWGRVKILAYTNDAVDFYNKWLSTVFNGDSEPKVGQLMLANESCGNGASRVNNNAEVLIEEVEAAVVHNCSGWRLKLRNISGMYFMPSSRASRKAALAQARERDEHFIMQEIMDSWIDLRPSFACTVNKAQGSTYDYVFIDLGNIMKKVHQVGQLARILYVGCSRTRKGMFFTGDTKG